ncbi:MAG: DUF4870 domain-containing protein [Chthoniobacterales bacterium]
MPDPLEPSEPPPPAPPPPTPAPASPMSPDPSTRLTSTGLPSNVAAALACIPLVGGIIFYVLEKRDGFVRFYAMQSIIFGGAWILFVIIYSVAHFILTPIPAIGFFFALILWVVWALVGVAFLVLFIVTIVKAFTGVRWEIPYIGPIARSQLGEA